MMRKKKHKPKTISLNNIVIAKKNISKMAKEEVDEMIDPLWLSVKRAYSESMTSDAYVIIATVVAMAKELEEHSSVKGFSPIIDSAIQSLIDIQKRSISTGLWVDSQCREREINSLTNFVAAHKFQLRSCTKQEISNCASRLESRSKSLKKIIKVKLNVDATLNQLKQDTEQVQLTSPSFEVI